MNKFLNNVFWRNLPAWVVFGTVIGMSIYRSRKGAPKQIKKLKADQPLGQTQQAFEPMQFADLPEDQISQLTPQEAQQLAAMQQAAIAQQQQMAAQQMAAQQQMMGQQQQAPWLPFDLPFSPYQQAPQAQVSPQAQGTGSYMGSWSDYYGTGW